MIQRCSLCFELCTECVAAECSSTDLIHRSTDETSACNVSNIKGSMKLELTRCLTSPVLSAICATALCDCAIFSLMLMADVLCVTCLLLFCAELRRWPSCAPQQLQSSHSPPSQQPRSCQQLATCTAPAPPVLVQVLILNMHHHHQVLQVLVLVQQ